MNWPSTWEWSLFLFYLQHGAEQELMAQNMACHKLLLVKTLPCLHPSLLVFFWEQSINITFHTERKLCKIEIKWKERLPKLVLCSWSEVFNNKLLICATEKKIPVRNYLIIKKFSHCHLLTIQSVSHLTLLKCFEPTLYPKKNMITIYSENCPKKSA